MIFDHLIPKLKETFPNRGLRIDREKRVAVFPAIHPAFGDIEIHDDGDEITLVAGNFTHGHFSNYEQGMPQDEASKQILDNVIRFLRSVFADRVVFFGSHKGSGGWQDRSSNESFLRKLLPGAKRKYVWSGPLE